MADRYILREWSVYPGDNEHRFRVTDTLRRQSVDVKVDVSDCGANRNRLVAALYASVALLGGRDA
jgi:hypothetical protein